jgi:hypothetical protein
VLGLAFRIIAKDRNRLQLLISFWLRGGLSGVTGNTVAKQSTGVRRLGNTKTAKPLPTVVKSGNRISQAFWLFPNCNQDEIIVGWARFCAHAVFNSAWAQKRAHPTFEKVNEC